MDRKSVEIIFGGNEYDDMLNLKFNSIINVFSKHIIDTKFDDIKICEFDFAEIKDYMTLGVFLKFPVLADLFANGCAVTQIAINGYNNDKMFNIVIVNKAIRQVLSEGEMTFVVGHEIGHIRLGHFDKVEESFIDNIDLEEEADRYSIREYNKLVEINTNTLQKLVNFNIQYVYKLRHGGKGNIGLKILFAVSNKIANGKRIKRAITYLKDFRRRNNVDCGINSVAAATGKLF